MGPEPAINVTDKPVGFNLKDWLNCKRGYFIMFPVFAILFFLVVYPVSILIFGSFSEMPPRAMNLDFSSLTLAHYQLIFTNPVYMEAFKNTMLAALLGTILALLIGVWFAWLVARTDIPFKKTIDVAVIVPLFISAFISSLAWSMLAAPRMGLLNVILREIGLPVTLNIHSMGGIIFLFGVYYSPYIYMFTVSALRRMDPVLEEAANISGAGTFKTMFKITFPVILPAITSSTLLVFILMAEDFAIPFIIGNQVGLRFITSEMFKLMSAIPPQINLATALGIILIAITFTLIYIQGRVLKKRSFVTVSGKGLRPKLISLGKARYLCFFSSVLYIFVAVVLPCVALISTAFRRVGYLPDIRSIFSAELFTLDYVKFAISYPMITTALKNTLYLVIICSIAGLLLYLTLSYMINKTNLPGRSTLNYISMMPLAICGLVIGLAYLWAWIVMPIGIYGTIWILGLAIISRLTPQGVRAISSSIVQVHPELEEAARISGSSVVHMMRRIMLPLVKPGIGSALILIIILTVRELSSSIFLYTSRTIMLSVAIFDLWETGMWGAVSVLALLQGLILLVVIVVGQKLLKADVIGK